MVSISGTNYVFSRIAHGVNESRPYSLRKALCNGYVSNTQSTTDAQNEEQGSMVFMGIYFERWHVTSPFPSHFVRKGLMGGGQKRSW